VKVATALKFCCAGVAVTVAAVVAEFASFYLHLFVLPVLGLPVLLVLTLAPALCGVAIYQRALKSE
jgi:hypothetical protein